MKITSVYFEVEITREQAYHSIGLMADDDVDISADVDLPEGFIPFYVSGPHTTGDQRRDSFGPFPFRLWGYSE